MDGLPALFAVVLAIWVGRRLWRRSRLLALVATMATGLVGIAGTEVVKAHLSGRAAWSSPERQAEALMAEVLKATPAMAEVFELDPALRQELKAELVQIIGRHPRSDSAGVEADVAGAALRIGLRVNAVALKAGDEPVFAMVKAEDDLLAILAAEDVRACAARVRTAVLNPLLLSSQARAAFSQSLKATARAYQEGKDAPLPGVIPPEQGRRLLAAALTALPDPVSPAEAVDFDKLKSLPDDRACALGRKFQAKMVASSPRDAAAIMRFLFLGSTSS